jgi:hypothetical protein
MKPISVAIISDINLAQWGQTNILGNPTNEENVSNGWPCIYIRHRRITPREKTNSIYLKENYSLFNKLEFRICTK